MPLFEASMRYFQDIFDIIFSSFTYYIYCHDFTFLLRYIFTFHAWYADFISLMLCFIYISFIYTFHLIDDIIFHFRHFAWYKMRLLFNKSLTLQIYYIDMTLFRALRLPLHSYWAADTLLLLLIKEHISFLLDYIFAAEAFSIHFISEPTLFLLMSWLRHD